MSIKCGFWVDMILIHNTKVAITCKYYQRLYIAICLPTRLFHQYKSNYVPYINSHRFLSLSLLFTTELAGHASIQIYNTENIQLFDCNGRSTTYYANFRQILSIQFIVFVRFWVLLDDNNLLWPNQKQL